MHLDKISHTREDTFRQCGWKYKLRYVERIPGEVDNQAFAFGNFIHKVFELGYQAKDLSTLSSIGEEVRKNYRLNQDKYPESLIKKCYKNFLKFNSGLSETVKVEERIELEREGYIQIAIIDRIVKGTEGGLLIIDYKTSKREKTKLELFEDKQLQRYTSVVSELYKVPISDIVASHFYPITGNFVHVSYHKWQEVQTLNEQDTNVATIRATKAETLVPTKNMFCNWCEFKKNLCPLFSDPSVVAANIEEAKAYKLAKSNKS